MLFDAHIVNDHFHESVVTLSTENIAKQLRIVGKVRMIVRLRDRVVVSLIVYLEGPLSNDCMQVVRAYPFLQVRIVAWILHLDLESVKMENACGIVIVLVSVEFESHSKVPQAVIVQIMRLNCDSLATH